MRDDFAVFILCHGRPDNVITWDTLKRCGYTGRIYIILDDEDKTIPGYQEKFGKDNCLIFSKDEMLKYMDPMDLMHHKKCAVYARNACYYLAKANNIKYFCQIDDDMVDLAYRTEINGELKRQRCYQADKVFECLLNLLNSNDNLYSVAIAQPGDYIGGKGSTMARNKYKRKCMNFWMCDVDKWLVYNGTLNDDVNTYYINGHRGKLFLTVGSIMTDQPETQSVSGGMSDIYLQLNTYVKSFYTVMLNPSACKVSVFRSIYPRIHHKIFEEHAYPRVISDRFKIKEDLK